MVRAKVARMGKSSSSKKTGKRSHSTTKRGATVKRSSDLRRERIIQLSQELSALLGCECGDPCDGLASGGVFTCEDGVMTYVPPVEYFAVLVRNPNSHGGLPYWERPINLGLNCPTTAPPLEPKSRRSRKARVARKS